MNKDDKVKDAIEELDALEKSQEEVADDGISALEKALSDFGEDDEDLEKSEDNDEDDKGGDDDKEGEDDKEGDEGEDGKGMEKSLEENELEQELIKASEAYADLEQSVNALAKSHGDQFDEMRAALASLTSLTMAVGKGVVALSKSVREFGGQPYVSGKKPLLGEGKGSVTEGLAKSKSEVMDLIKSAVEADKIDIRWMSKVAVNGVECLPDDIKTAIGL